MFLVKGTERRMLRGIPAAIGEVQTSAESDKLPVAWLFRVVRGDVRNNQLLVEGEETRDKRGSDDLVGYTAEPLNDSGLHVGVAEKCSRDLVAGVHEPPDANESVARGEDLVPDHEQDGDALGGLELEQVSKG